MAKRKNQFLINLHTSELNSLPTEARLGEIAVRHNESKPELIIKVGEETGNTFATFIDKNAVSGLLTTVNTDLIGRIDGLTDNLSENYATSAATEAAIKAVDGRVDTLSNKLTTDYATSAATEAAIKAVDGKFASYATSAATEAAIKAVDGKFASYATSAATDTAIKAVDGKVDALDERIDSLEALSATTQSAIQSATFAEGAAAKSGVKIEKSDTTLVFDFSELIIDCGEF